MASSATPSERPTAPTDAVLSILRSHDFCQAYLDALDHADHTPAAQRTAARSFLESHFRLEEIDPTAALNPDSVYFTEHPVEVHGHYKFLVPGAVKRDLISGRLFLLTPRANAAEVKPSIDTHEFGAAIAAVEAVRLTLIPERVNGIISFIADAQKYYAAGNAAGAEQEHGAFEEPLHVRGDRQCSVFCRIRLRTDDLSRIVDFDHDLDRPGVAGR